MKIVLLGAPGSGKGTRAKVISELYQIPSISTGDIFRENMANGTPIGLMVKEIMASGGLCPDELTIELVKERIAKPDCKNGYLLDGFPRNLVQAKSLDEISAPDKVVNIEVPFDLIEKRLAGRRICESCKGTFHTDVVGTSMVCPSCGGKLIIRKDDTPEVIKERLEVYQNHTAPLIEYYEKQNKLISVSGNTSIEEIPNVIKKALQ